MNTTIRERDIIFIEPGQPLSFEMLDGSLIITVTPPDPLLPPPYTRGRSEAGVGGVTHCRIEYRFEKRVPPLIQAQKN